MLDAVTDTHALIWYLEDSSKLGQAASRVFDACDAGENLIFIPTICLVEIIFLEEKGRISADLLAHLTLELGVESSGLRLVDLTFGIASAVARVPRSQVPELPDRIIAATALALDLPLITRDQKIRASQLETIW